MWFIFVVRTSFVSSVVKERNEDGINETRANGERWVEEQLNHLGMQFPLRSAGRLRLTHSVALLPSVLGPLRDHPGNALPRSTLLLHAHRHPDRGYPKHQKTPPLDRTPPDGLHPHLVGRLETPNSLLYELIRYSARCAHHDAKHASRSLSPRRAFESGVRLHRTRLGGGQASKFKLPQHHGPSSTRSEPCPNITLTIARRLENVRDDDSHGALFRSGFAVRTERMRGCA